MSRNSHKDRFGSESDLKAAFISPTYEFSHKHCQISDIGPAIQSPRRRGRASGISRNGEVMDARRLLRLDAGELDWDGTVPLAF
jgi:hypothetical protein